VKRDLSTVFSAQILAKKNRTAWKECIFYSSYGGGRRDITFSDLIKVPRHKMNAFFDNLKLPV